MTVADNTSRNQYTATSGQTVFAYTFEIVDKSHIVVLKNGVALSEGTNYAVSNVGNDSGGNITLTVGATTGDIMTFYRDMPYSRTQNYTNSGDFLASEVNSDFDDLWLAGEQTDRSFSQSIRKPITDSDSISVELPEAASRANKFLKFDANGAVDLAAGVTTDVAADDVSITDAGGYYTSDNVEGALQEIGAQPPGFDPNTDSFNIGSDAVSSGTDSIALGHDASATAARDIALGFDAVASGGGSIAIGQETDSTGVRSIAIGKGAQSTFSTSIALGENASTLGGAGGSPVAIGYNASSTGISGISLGPNTTSSGSQSISIGDTVSATGTDSIALGHDASATGDKTISIGFASYASFVDAIAIGNDTRSDALGSIAIGTGSDASRLGSVALGKGAQATGAGSTIAIGEAATTFQGLASPIAIGFQANTTGAYGVGIGYQTVTSGAQSIAIGYIASATNDNSIAIGRQLTVAGQKAVGIGWSAVAGAFDSIGIGTSANASTTDCISIGGSSQSLSTGGIAIGSGAITSAGNIKGVAVGYAAQAQQIGGVAVGNNAICNSQFGTALGRDSNASSGSYATALGYGSVASNYATAINDSDATGARSIAIGHSAVSSSADSIAIGYNADALGTDSIAIGNIAGADAENTIHINASGVATNQPQTAGYIVIETDDASLNYDGSWSLTGGPLEVAGGITTTGNVSFGDNDKAIFGADLDLQIYSTGANGFIENNTGLLILKNNSDDRDVAIQSDDGAGGVANYLLADGSTGALNAYHYGNQKLATTSTGVDVTGSVVSDGLVVNSGVVDEVARFEGTGSPYVSWYDSGVRQAYIGSFGNVFSIIGDTPDTTVSIATGGVNRVNVTSTGLDVTGTVTADGLTLANATYISQNDSASGQPRVFGFNASNDMYMGPVDSYAGGAIFYGVSSGVSSQVLYTDAKQRLRISSGGDISFYEDTGTTAKFHWSASDENLSITGQKDSASLTLSAPLNTIGGGSLADYNEVLFDNSQVAGASGQAYLRHYANSHNDQGSALAFGVTTTAGTANEALRIDSNGNVGIDTSSPATALEVNGDIGIGRTSGGYTFREVVGGGERASMKSNASNELLFSIGGASEAMRIDSAGNVGIGTDSPASLVAGGSSPVLTIGGADSGLVTGEKAGSLSFITSDPSYTATYTDGLTGEMVSVAESATGAAYGLAFYTGTTTSSNRGERVRISSAGNVGIGTSSPARQLTVENAGGNAIASIKSGTSNASFLLMGDTASDNIGMLKYNNADDSLGFFAGSNSAERMRLDSAGNVLVGQTSADSNSVGIGLLASGTAYAVRSGGAPIIAHRKTSDGAIIDVMKDNVAVGSISSWDQSGSSRISMVNPNGNGFGIFRDSSTVAQIVPMNTAGNGDAVHSLGRSDYRWKDLHLSGEVNITDAASPTVRLVDSTNSNTLLMYAQDSTSHVGTYSNHPLVFDTNSTEAMRLDASRNLLVGKTGTTLAATGAEIRATGFIRATVDDTTCIQANRTTGTGTAIDLRYAGTSVGSIAVGVSSTTYNTSSDQRLKDNIVDAPSASDDIDAIQVRSFDWKADGSHQKYGMIAQELNTVAPEAVSEGETEEDMMGVDYSKLVPMLVKEIQSLRARVAQLETN